MNSKKLLAALLVPIMLLCAACGAPKIKSLNITYAKLQSIINEQLEANNANYTLPEFVEVQSKENPSDTYYRSKPCDELSVTVDESEYGDTISVYLFYNMTTSKKDFGELLDDFTEISKAFTYVTKDEDEWPTILSETQFMTKTSFESTTIGNNMYSYSYYGYSSVVTLIFSATISK